MSNWNGKAIKIPRIEVASCNRDDITQAGVYFLLCKEDDGSDSVYIGKAENVKDRLVQHLRDYQSEKEKYYWSTAVVFIGRDLAHNSRGYGESVATVIDAEVKRIIDECYARARHIIRKYDDVLHACAELLLEKEKISREEFEALFTGEVSES